ncbi:MAG: hypothetical protein KGQ59_08025 [Bdellovibrionales bacterium]|nr:hypothetical protein [Bdellovibrionales bacterium]
MKKFLIAGVVLTLILGSAFFLRGKPSATPPQTEEKSSSILPVTNGDPKKAQAFISQSFASRPVSASDQTKDPAPCMEAWKKLTQSDANHWGTQDGAISQPSFSFKGSAPILKLRDSLDYSKKCQLSQDHPLQSVSELVRQKCYTPKTKSNDQLEDLGCLISLMKLRFETIEYLSQGQSIDQIQDPGLIGAQIFAQVLKDEQKRDPGKLLALSRRALELDPSNTVAAEYGVHGAFLAAQGSESSQSLQEFEQAADALSKAQPHSPLAFQAKMEIARQRGDFSGIEKMAEEARSQGLSADLVNYELAWSSYREGKMESSERYLQAILEKNPNDVRAKGSLELLQKNQTLKDQFKSGVSPFFGDLGGLQYSFSLSPEESETSPSASE